MDSVVAVIGFSVLLHLAFPGAAKMLPGQLIHSCLIPGLGWLEQPDLMLCLCRFARWVFWASLQHDDSTDLDFLCEVWLPSE